MGGYIGLTTFGFIQVVQDFEYLFILALLILGVGILVNAVVFRKDGGRPRVRLFGAFRWYECGLLLMVSLTCGLVALAQGPFPTWFSTISSVASILFAVAGSSVWDWRRLDLREQGVALQRACYWPWPQVRVIEWDCEESGRLVLGRGWRQLESNVPPDQRDAVDALLKEKLGNDSEG